MSRIQLPQQLRQTLFLIIVPCVLLLRPDPVAGMDFRLAIGAVEGGDDRFQPAAGARFTAPSGIIGSAWLYGRDYGPVKERTYILSGAQPFNPFGTDKVTVMAGISVLMERTSVEGAPGEGKTADSSSNFGALFGLRAKIHEWKNFSADAAWESHLYPAGSQILLLVTGRKQVISLNAGVDL